MMALLPDLGFEIDDISQEDLRDIDILEESIFGVTGDISLKTNPCDLHEADNIDDSEDEIIRPPKKSTHRRLRVIASDSESETDSIEKAVRESLADIGSTSTSQKWSMPRGHQPSVIAFTEQAGLKPPYAQQLRAAAPAEYFKLIVPDEVFEMIAEQTNLFAQQSETLTLQGIPRPRKPQSRTNDWKPTTCDEIKKLFGLVLYMGLVRLPKMSLYWSKDKVFGQTFPATVMSRNRFELLLRNVHFSDNETADKTDRINKIRPLIDTLNENFEKYYGPKEEVCVDESQVPFRGRLIFRQYNKSKRHKYGMKLFKLCTIPGYTCKLQLYAGKNHELENTTPFKVVMSLYAHILNRGHTLATDNWYTSIDLAHELISKDTHLVGTLRKNRKGLPKNVVDAKLEKGESIAMENERGVCVLKWKDKRDVLMLSTKHSKGSSTIHKKGKVIKKPRMILAYNKAKGSVDMSDQMTSYSSPLRKTLKWYRKLAFELILNTGVVNAWVMYTENTKIKLGIVQFKRQLVDYLTTPGIVQTEEIPEDRPIRVKHKMMKKEGSVRKARRFCVECYKECVKIHGSRMAKNKTKKVATYCKTCPGEPFYCLPCFNRIHRRV